MSIKGQISDDSLCSFQNLVKSPKNSDPRKIMRRHLDKGLNIASKKKKNKKQKKNKNSDVTTVYRNLMI